MNIKIKGFTVIELVISVSVLGLFVLMIHPIFTYSKKAGETMSKLDVYHDIRRIDKEVFDELKLGSGILYPPKPEDYSSGEWYHQLVFRNHLNQTIMLYVNKQDKLVMFNYDNVKNSVLSLGRSIGSNIKEFSVKRQGSSVIEYRLVFVLDEKEFLISNRVAMVNVL